MTFHDHIQCITASLPPLGTAKSKAEDDADPTCSFFLPESSSSRSLYWHSRSRFVLDGNFTSSRAAICIQDMRKCCQVYIRDILEGLLLHISHMKHETAEKAPAGSLPSHQQGRFSPTSTRILFLRDVILRTPETFIFLYHYHGGFSIETRAARLNLTEPLGYIHRTVRKPRTKQTRHDLKIESHMFVIQLFWFEHLVSSISYSLMTAILTLLTFIELLPAYSKKCFDTLHWTG